MSVVQLRSNMTPMGANDAVMDRKNQSEKEKGCSDGQEKPVWQRKRMQWWIGKTSLKEKDAVIDRKYQSETEKTRHLC